MDLSKVGERLLTSVKSARSLGLLPFQSDRPEVPVRAATAAAIARALSSLPPHQRLSLPLHSGDLVSIYGVKHQDQPVEELEEDFYEEDFDPVRHMLEHIPSDENDASYFERKAALRLAQLDVIAERLSHHVMEHHEQMVKGMQLVMEVEHDLKIANVICMNGRRHVRSSMHEVSRDLVVTSSAKKKQALLDLLPVLTQLRHALDMQVDLDTHVENGNYVRAFQVLSEYLQVLDGFSDLSAVQEMIHGAEVWLEKALQKLDSQLLSVCQEFKEKDYVNVVDAYALVGDIAGLVEKMQSFYMQEVLSDTQTALKDILQEDLNLQDPHKSRLTYSDLCLQIPESKFRRCLLYTLNVLFKIMSSYYAIMSFRLDDQENLHVASSLDKPEKPVQLNAAASDVLSHADQSSSEIITYGGDGHVIADLSNKPQDSSSSLCDGQRPVVEATDDPTPSSSSSCDQLRKESVAYIAQALQKGRRNLWHLTASRVSVLLSCSAASSTSTHQFLKNYEDLNSFVLAGEAFCGAEASEFRQRLKIVSENYLASLHRQSICALKMVLEKETWLQITPETVQMLNLAGLVGDGAPVIVHHFVNTPKILHSSGSGRESGHLKSGFARWFKMGNPFDLKHVDDISSPRSYDNNNNGSQNGRIAHGNSQRNEEDVNGPSIEDENEDLLADFIDEDSQLPSRISRPSYARKHSANWEGNENGILTGSSLSLLRLMDKYARLMQKLGVVNIEFFKGICQLFELYFYVIFETFGHRDAFIAVKGHPEALTYRLKAALTRITHELSEQRIRSPNSSTSVNGTFDVTPTCPSITNLAPNTTFGLKERCNGVESILQIAQILHQSRVHLQSMILENNTALVDEFYINVVDAVPDLIEHIHRTTAKYLLNINGYVERIASAKWEVKDLGLEHNGYVDLLLGEFKHYKTRLAHGGIRKEVQDLLLEYGLDNVAEVFIEGLSRVKRCTNEGRALMALDLQVLINGLQHFTSLNVKPKLLIVETFIKAYYLPETEYVHWARSHPEYTKSQITGLVNLVATMNNWKRKTRLEVLEKIETGNL
ncbi:uncharacterized protein LOC116252643 isoform X2 [Nymphaea colorata]|uniref:uncharacterized protein LOC116252643 isoform X2 n=1 Tax=Nymphaea colorata TaxID=210225 RepID=UPI00129D7A5F|nr:uncharacterized protein LOC116252643 isoform X2 [Nymphaea colorata]